MIRFPTSGHLLLNYVSSNNKQGLLLIVVIIVSINTNLVIINFQGSMQYVYITLNEFGIINNNYVNVLFSSGHPSNYWSWTMQLDFGNNLKTVLFLCHKDH